MGDKTLEKLVENIAFDQGRRLVRIERARIAEFATMPNHGGRRLGRTADLCLDGQSKDGKNDGGDAQ